MAATLAPATGRQRARTRGLPIFAVIVFAISILPPVFMLLPQSYDAEPVQELRPLAPAPGHWQGSWLNADGNFQLAQKWFNDHVGLRNFMIRAKNEVDYRLFRTSSRVYFGHHGMIFSRSIADLEIPGSERALGAPGEVEAIHQGILRFTEQLQSEGITPIYLFPYMKQYFYGNNLPAIAPKLGFPTYFQQLNQELQADPRLHVMDTYTPVLPTNKPYPTYMLQDFHWTDAAAFTIARTIVGEISKLEGRPHNVWTHPLETLTLPRVGSEARFSARLFMPPASQSGEIKPTYRKRPETQFNPKTTGIEYETDMLADPALLPPTCLFGNSFSDQLTYAGLPVYFQQLIHLNREGPILDAPRVCKGKCKYLIVQILDIQPWLLASFANVPGS